MAKRAESLCLKHFVRNKQKSMRKVHVYNVVASDITNPVKLKLPESPTFKMLLLVYSLM